MKNTASDNNIIPMGEKLPTVYISDDFTIVSMNERAKLEPLFEEGAVGIGADDRENVQKLLEEKGFASLRLTFFPYCGAILNFVRTESGVAAFLVPEELISGGTSVSTDGLEVITSEIRNELHNTFVMIHSLENEIGDSVDALVSLERLKRSNYKMLRTAQAVASVSRFESDTFEPFLQIINVTAFLQKLSASIESVGIGGRETGFSWKVPDSPVYAKVDSKMMEQALINILSNSFKYTRDGNSVSLEMEKKGDRITILIKDKGAGIKPHNLDFVKHPYFSVDPADDGGERPGVGVGLSIAEAAVRAFGGTMVISSEFGEGTSVALTIPVYDGAFSASTVRSDDTNYVSNRFSPLYIGFCEICDLP